jgi:hypothetical protein
MAGVYHMMQITRKATTCCYVALIIIPCSVVYCRQDICCAAVCLLCSHAYSVGLVQESAALLKPTAASPSVGAGPATTPGDVSIAVVGGNIICGDVAAGKAVVHVVDKVILTPGIAHQLGVPLKGMDPHHNAARSTRSSHQHHWQLAAVAAATVVVMVAGAV